MLKRNCFLGAKGGQNDRRCLRSFRDNEEGTLSIFSIFMFFVIIGVAGIGIDLMYNELRRIKLQAALDNAILAAADLDQQLPAAQVVADYFDKVGYTQYLTGTTVDEGDNYRVVSATAQQSNPTMIVHLLGVDELAAPAAGTAEERFTEIEISMVLDISGSMGDNNKMPNLQAAAGEFVDLVLHPSMGDNVSVSLVPYSMHVNAGPELMSQFSVNHFHNYSHCMEFPDAEFSDPALDTSVTYGQMEHYQWNYYTGNDYEEPQCPQEVYERITPISKNADHLKAQINSLQPRGGTQIHIGMKWGMGLLDRSFNTIQQSMIGDGIADPDFADRPLVDTGDAVEKHIVLMTDGKNSTTSRLQPWAYDTQDEVELWASYNFLYATYYNVLYSGNNVGGAAPVPNPLDTRGDYDPLSVGRPYGLTNNPNAVYVDPAYASNLANNCGNQALSGGGMGVGNTCNGLGLTLGAAGGLLWDLVGGTLAGLWTFPATTGGPGGFDAVFDGTVESGTSWWEYYYTKHTPGQADALLAAACTAAKSQGIIVWTVGFEVDDHGNNVMQACASSPSHHFRVENTEISTAFRQIASQISQLRLTQ